MSSIYYLLLNQIECSLVYCGLELKLKSLNQWYTCGYIMWNLLLDSVIFNPSFSTFGLYLSPSDVISRSWFLKHLTSPSLKPMYGFSTKPSLTGLGFLPAEAGYFYPPSTTLKREKETASICLKWKYSDSYNFFPISA